MTFARHILAAALLGLGLSATAMAAGPLQKGQAPGYYRVMLGDFEVTALSDGTVGLPMTKLLNNPAGAEATEKALARAFLKDPVETSVNGYLVNTGAKLVLIDAGAGSLFGPTLGRLVANLKAAGYTPEQVDEVYITHLHPDHVGGLAADGKPVFANATVRADQKDADFWLSQKNLDAAPADSKGFFQGAMASLNPYVAAGKFKAFSGNTDLLPGLRAQVSYGHTPGHSFYVVESKGEKLVLWGDVMHAAAVQFMSPMVTIGFDTDNQRAAEQRGQAYADAAAKGYWVGAAHLAFPGLGRLRAAEGNAYVFVPANYRSAP
ncbi:MAG: MBL fold metallo-hydrolase [Burkholderiales bacterium PBB5]|nr:MAG: MBL fold metallo-hydrolase [Burkholderiales bacterium PBB5]